MEEFMAQWGLLVILVLVALYVLTRGRKYLDKLKSDAKDATIKALMKETGIDKLPDPEKIAKVAEIANAMKNANPKKLAGNAIQVLADEAIAAMPEKKIPVEVGETDDPDGLLGALNKAIKAETKREKWKRGGRKALSIGAKIIGSII